MRRSIENQHVAPKVEKRDGGVGTRDSMTYEGDRILSVPEQVHHYVDRESPLKGQLSSKPKITLGVRRDFGGGSEFRTTQADLTYSRPHEKMTFLKFLVSVVMLGGILEYFGVPIVPDKTLLMNPDFWLGLLQNPIAIVVAAVIVLSVLGILFQPEE